MKQADEHTDDGARRESRAAEKLIYAMLRTFGEYDGRRRSRRSKVQRIPVRPGSILDRAGIAYYVEAQPRDAYGRFTFKPRHKSVGTVADESEDRQ